MVFRMLLGRDALKGDFLVDPGRILCQGKMKRSDIRTLYKNKDKGHICH